MSAAPFMQVYVADYTADTQHLTCEEDGAYWRLLRAMWRSKGVLRNDPKFLARICGVTLPRWLKMAPTIMDLFTVDDGRITQKRLSEEFEKAAGKSQKRSRAGALGGKVTALKNKEKAQANAAPMPQHSLEPESDTPLKNPTDSHPPMGEVIPFEKPKPQRRKERRCPPRWEPDETTLAVACELGFTDAGLEAEMVVFRDHEFGTPKSDWNGTFRNWLRRSAKHRGFSHGRGTPDLSSSRHARQVANAQQGLMDFVDGK
jgi:uncharacterized protein YdaU (DUF1376 family)